MWTMVTGFVAALIIAYFVARVMKDVPALEGDRRASVFGRWLEPAQEKFQARARAAVPKSSPESPDYMDPMLRPRIPLWLTIAAPFAGAILLVVIARHSSRHPHEMLWKVVTVIAGILLIAAFFAPSIYSRIQERREEEERHRD